MAARMACSSSSVLCTEQEEEATERFTPKTQVSPPWPSLGPHCAPGPALTEPVEQHVALSDPLLDLDELQRHPRPNLEEWQKTGRGVSPSSGMGEHQACPALSLTSVSRTALCWARMLPRPATACGSSVMLCSPSGSASLSDSPAPLRWAHVGLSRGSLALGQLCGPLVCGATNPAASPCPPHVASSSLMSCRRLMLGNFSWRSFFIPRLAPTGTTLMLLQGWEGGKDGGQEPWGHRSALPCQPFPVRQRVYFD